MVYKPTVIIHTIRRDGIACANRLHADDMSDAAPTAKNRKLLGSRA